MKKTILALTLLACSLAAAAPPPVLPFRDLRTGMKGTGRTVFEGTAVQTFDVEIVGLLPNIGPGQDLILGKCTGGPLERTAVLSGMSGSPVFVDGKLIGAVAYSWGFAKEAIAGITPIEEMLRVGELPDRTAARRPGSAPAMSEARRLLSRPEGIPAFLTTALSGLRPAVSGGATHPIALSVGGLGTTGLARIAPSLREAGFLPVQAGSGGRATAESPALEPGSPVGIKLVRGDVDFTATGTVTWVDGPRLFAFGHPLYSLGSIDLPMTGARVETLMPSLEQSARIAVPLSEVGAFRQDRAPAIFGRIGAAPKMIPVRLQMNDGAGRSRNFAFDLADDPLLAPVFFYEALNGILAATERVYGSLTLRLREGSVIRMTGEEEVELDNLFAGPAAPGQATGLSAYILYLLLNNEWKTPEITGINLILDYDEEPKTGSIRRVTLDRYRVHPGETLTVSAVVAPYRGAETVLTREIEIPAETPPGRLLLEVGDAASLNRAEAEEDGFAPRTLKQLVGLVNRLRRNDRIYIVGIRADSGVFVGGARLPNLPPSAQAILSRPRSFGHTTVIPQRGILEEEILIPYAAEGFARVPLDVEAP